MTNDTDTTPVFTLYVFGSRAAATAALTLALTGTGDARTALLEAARVGDLPARLIASRVVGAARRQGMAGASPTVLARRLPDMLKGNAYVTLPYGDDDRTIVVTRAGAALKPTARTLTTTAAKRMERARPALAQVAAMRPKLIAA